MTQYNLDSSFKNTCKTKHIVVWLILLLVLLSCLSVIIFFVIKMYREYKNQKDKDDEMIRTRAKITNVKECKVINTDNVRSPNNTICNLSIKYIINNVDYMADIVTYDNQHVVNEDIEISYNKNNYNDVKYKYVDASSIYWILLSVVGILPFTLSIVSLYNLIECYKFRSDITKV